MDKTTNGNFITYFKFYKKYIGRNLFITLSLSVFVTLLDSVSLLLFLPLINAAGSERGLSKMPGAGIISLLSGIISKTGLNFTTNNILLLITLLFIIKGGIRYLQLNFQVRSKHHLIKEIRLMLYNKLNSFKYRDFLDFEPSYIHNTLTVEVQYLIQTINPFLFFIQSGVILFIYILLSVAINFQFALTDFICLAVYIAFYNSMSIPVYKKAKKVTDKNRNFNDLLTQALKYFRYLKSTGRFDEFGTQIKQIISDTEQINRKIGADLSFSSSIKEPIIVFCIMMMVFFQLNYLHAGLNLVFINLLILFRILTTSSTAQSNRQSFYEHASSIDAVSELLTYGDLLEESRSERIFSGLKTEIVFNNVKLSFNNRPLFKGINIVIPANRTVAIIGKIGSGKTTLFNMICGLIPPDQGSILFDQNPVSAFDKNSLQLKIGSISQDTVIFNDTLFNNVTFWADRSAANVEKFWDILDLLSFKEFILKLPEAEDSTIGEHGIQLSGGQKQLINIARELFKNPEILLIDEATSALDAETENLVQTSLDKLHGKHTILIISHRICTVKKADMIYIIHEGRITDSGSYASLIEKSAYFRNLFELQSSSSTYT